MGIIVSILIGLLAFIHCYILFFEMFAWDTKGKKIFKSFPEDLFTPTKPLAANMGLYNGFLAAGLIWTFFISTVTWQINVSLFFLSCIAVAGIYGALTVEKKIFFIQGVPSIIAIILILFG